MTYLLIQNVEKESMQVDIILVIVMNIIVPMRKTLNIILAISISQSAREIIAMNIYLAL